MASYISLFLSAFLAATLLPAQSEALLVGTIIYSPEQVLQLIAIASIGNTLGSLTNWAIGRFLNHRYASRIDVQSKTAQRAVSLYKRWGWVSLLASWVPIIGDPLTFVSGVMKEPLWRFIVIVSFAKTLRYVVLGYITVSSLS